MIKSWKPQVRSFAGNRIIFWIFCGLLALSAGYYYSQINIQVSIWIIAIYVCFCISIYIKVRIWNVDGYEKITIDTAKRVIIFDDKQIIPFDTISSIQYTIENNPSNPLLNRSDIFFDNGRIDILKINSCLTLYVGAGYSVDFAIQNKIAAKRIIGLLTKNGFVVNKTDNRTLNVALLIKTIIAFIAVIALVIIMLHK